MSAVKLTKKQLAQLGAVAAMHPDFPASIFIQFLNEVGLSKLDDGKILATKDSVIVASNGKIVRRLPITPTLNEEVANG